jgi:phosphonate transport system permease protein
MTIAADPAAAPAARRAAADRLFTRKRLIAFGIPTLVLAYLAYVFFAFDVPGLAQRAKLENAVILMSDSVRHKVHVTRDNRTGAVSVAVEGERKGAWPEGKGPEWVSLGETTVIDLGRGHVVTYLPDGSVTFEIPDYGTIVARPGAEGIAVELPPGEVPAWISASDTRLGVTTPAGRLTVTRNRTEVFRYFWGWELFFFTLDSPFHGKGAGELLALALWQDRLDPAVPNAVAMWRGFWFNAMWRHADVAWAIGETVLMAFLGTFGAAMAALPLAFLAAGNFAPSRWLRFAIRRLFDFVRGVDGLIWTIILSRAFGPGPMTGALAILVTDTGTFGKLFSEALENVDGRQIEGVQSTGARPVQRYRFGVIPQVAPVLLSQVLYLFESNSRSATIIGAIVGGGIGLMLTQAIQTQKDWEEVAYYMVLIVLMVAVMDWLSGWLRRKLIRGE